MPAMVPSIASINDAGDGENEALSSGQTAPDYRQDLDWLFARGSRDGHRLSRPTANRWLVVRGTEPSSFGTLPKNDSSATCPDTVRTRGPCA